ncbi:hypothetical protein RHGRI_033462 [Rhododendron griersonianum]|uniref:pantothenate kinase n=2 Tax=Rhododendron griersonianum TaxID=479676 RepID=A0AAV6I004_9ERIC|nr:hypothetical protein RHGRI_033462 [Rhododendron griersonianum]
MEIASPQPSADEGSHLAVDIGGSLIKLVYSSNNSEPDGKGKQSSKECSGVSNDSNDYPVLGGRLHFAKFETSKINDCLEFISSKQLHRHGRWRHEAAGHDKDTIKATGGGAYRFADLFKEKLGVGLDKVDEMDCLVSGANFLLNNAFLLVNNCGSLLFEGATNFTDVKPDRGATNFTELNHDMGQAPVMELSAHWVLELYDPLEVGVYFPLALRVLGDTAVHPEAFTYINGREEYVQIDPNDLYPYLLVNIGSGVSMIKVDGDGKFERVSGTSVGGGTFWGLGRLLTNCKSFDELLELSHNGNNRVIDMLVGDIYGGTDYMKIGLTSTTIASSFGKAISENKELGDYRPEDISRSLLRMISNNIGQISYLNALRFGLKRIFFGGFFIRGHAYTMDTISVAVHFWSKGEAQAMFLKHEGFLGALGAFMSYETHGIDTIITPSS